MLTENGRTRHVLYAEDEPAVAEMIEEALSEAGFRVTHAEDGRVALAEASRSRFDVLLTDVRMPNLDGVGLVRHLRSSQPGLPIVVLSGYMTQDDWQQLRQLGVPADSILEKPVSSAKLSSAVRNALTA